MLPDSKEGQPHALECSVALRRHTLTRFTEGPMIHQTAVR
jgi:hypothetical protein